MTPRRPAVPVTCRTCGNGFMRAPSLLRGRVYCSHACRCADRMPADVALARYRASQAAYARRRRAERRAAG
jgi:hypothetical protein